MQPRLSMDGEDYNWKVIFISMLHLLRGVGSGTPFNYTIGDKTL